MRDIKFQIAWRSTPQGSQRQSYRKFCRKHSGELLQKRTCWTDANESEGFVTVLPTTKNCGIRANDQMVRKVAGEKNFEECETGCACHGITDFVTNMLMKVQHVAVSENRVHDSCVPFFGDLDLKFPALSRQT